MKFLKSLLFLSLINFSYTSFSMSYVEAIKKFYNNNSEFINDASRGLIGGYLVKNAFDSFMTNNIAGGMGEGYLKAIQEADKLNTRNFYIRSLATTAQTANFLLPIDTNQKLNSLKRMLVRGLFSSIGFAVRGVVANW